MKILAIETSCDETAAAVVENGRRVLSNVIASQTEIHKLYGGVVPEIASRKHTEDIVPVVQQALDEANCSLCDLDALAVTAYPGLIGALLVGVNFAKGLSASTGLPLIPVHHIKGHIAANYLTHQELVPPFLCLVISGGHSHLIDVKSYTEFTVIGRTADDAAGEAFDKAARAMGFPYPGGIHIDQTAKSGNSAAYPLPSPVVSGRPLDFSFSGLKTAVINLIHNASQKNETMNIPDLCASFQQKVADILCDRVEKALAMTGHKKLVAAGGVSANSAIRAQLASLAKQKGIALFLPELSLCTDNAAMIGAQGYYEFLAGNRADASLNACASCEL